MLKSWSHIHQTVISNVRLGIEAAMCGEILISFEVFEGQACEVFIQVCYLHFPPLTPSLLHLIHLCHCISRYFLSL